MNQEEHEEGRNGRTRYVDDKNEATSATHNEDKDFGGTSAFVKRVQDAHGGLDRWRNFNMVAATVVSGGFLWGMKGFELGETPRRMTSEFRRQWTQVEPFGDPDWRMTYEPKRVLIETQGGELVAEQESPRATFAGHTWETPWTPLQLGYFNGYAMWTYYNLPFVLSEQGFEVAELPPITQDGKLLRGLQAHFPKNVHSHCPEQNLYFDEDGLLRRQDYQVDVAGGALAGHLISEYVEVEGLQFPTKRRVFMRNEDGTLQLDKMPVSVDLTDFELS